MLVPIVCLLAVILLIVLNASRRIDMTSHAASFFWMLVLPHITAVVYLLRSQPKLLIWAVITLFAYIFLKILIVPNLRREADSKRLFVMDGGRQQIIYCFYAQIIQIILYTVIFINCGFPKSVIFAADLIVTVLFVWVIGFSGIVRVILTSTWLSVLKRIASIVFLQFFGANLIAMFYLIRTAGLEYEFFTYKEIREDRRRELSSLCRTKYPIIMVHGLGFRDLRYINYWGRIPKVLKENGATIYHGHQEGWGTIQNNAEELKATILRVMEETGAKKVNIIAHSKGGLDARYAISGLKMGKYVASLTTVGTPHHGVKMVDWLVGMPAPLFRFFEKWVNGIFLRYGDKHPDFSAAAHDLTTTSAELFNQSCPDDPQVYYQSYTSVLKNIFSDYILLIPYIFIGITDSWDNDGLVTVESSQWGAFREVIRNRFHRGISHADIIDMKRENFRGFDVTEKYIEIVSELKDRGY